MVRKWYSQKETVEYFSISERTCLTIRQTGMLIEDTCWIRKISQNPNSNVLYNPVNCEEVLNVLERSRTMETFLRGVLLQLYPPFFIQTS